MQTPAFVIGSVVAKAGEPSPPAARCGCNFSQLGRVPANLVAIPAATGGLSSQDPFSLSQLILTFL